MIEKKAIKSLRNKKNILENERLQILENLNQNVEFNKLFLLRKNLIIEKSKAEFENVSFDNQKLKKCEKELETYLKKYSSTPLSLLQPVVYCQKCNDKYYIDGHKCMCLKQELTDLLKKESGMNKFSSFAECDFNIFSESEKMKKVYDTLEKWCDNPLSSKIVNFGFFGHTGTGKTFLTQCIADKLIKNGYFVYFTTAFNLHKNLIEYHTKNNNELLQNYINCDVLLIDDLGTENFIKNITENYFYTVINQRMLSSKPTIFTTNLDLNGIFERYGERIFSRLVNKQNSKVIWFENTDLRLKNR